MHKGTLLQAVGRVTTQIGAHAAHGLNRATHSGDAVLIVYDGREGRGPHAVYVGHDHRVAVAQQHPLDLGFVQRKRAPSLHDLAAEAIHFEVHPRREEAQRITLVEAFQRGLIVRRQQADLQGHKASSEKDNQGQSTISKNIC